MPPAAHSRLSCSCLHCRRWPRRHRTCTLSASPDITIKALPAVLTAQRVENFDALGASGFLRLELWAFPAAYSGGSLDGYKLAQHIFGPLSAGSFVENVNSGPVAFVPPPPGTWVLAMVLTEYSGLHHVNDGFVLRDWFTFVAPVVIGPADAGVIEFHNVILDHYFLTDDAGEAAGIDLGSAGPGWVRTGYGFNSGGNVSVCRFYGSVSPGPNSHFFTADEGGMRVYPAAAAGDDAGVAATLEFRGIRLASTPALNGLCPVAAGSGLPRIQQRPRARHRQQPSYRHQPGRNAAGRGARLDPGRHRDVRAPIGRARNVASSVPARRTRKENATLSVAFLTAAGKLT